MRYLIPGLLGMAIAGCAAPPGILAADPASRYPDLLATPPASLYLKPNGGDLELRFSNTIANVGRGPLRLTATVEGDRTLATQEIVDTDGRVLATRFAGAFEYHPTHHHTHVDNIAQYELRQGDRNGPRVSASKKVSYCMEDTIQYGSVRTPRMYPKCSARLQGISPGWADVYANDVPDQFLSVANLPAGEYTLITTVDPTRKLLDADFANNTSWVRLYLDPRTWRVTRRGESMRAPSSVTGEGRFWRPFWRGV